MSQVESVVSSVVESVVSSVIVTDETSQSTPNNAITYNNAPLSYDGQTLTYTPS